MTRNDTLASLAVNVWINRGRVIWPGAGLIDANLYCANLSDADLTRANMSDADLRFANMRGADLYCADLTGADLYCADLTGADLSGADLSSADLRGDKLAACVTSADRVDYEFRLFRLADGSHKVLAGCRWMTVDAYRAHVAREYPETDKARRTLGILDYFERVVAEAA